MKEEEEAPVKKQFAFQPASPIRPMFIFKAWPSNSDIIGFWLILKSKKSSDLCIGELFMISENCALKSLSISIFIIQQGWTISDYPLKKDGIWKLPIALDSKKRELLRNRSSS